jgi:hypothetical protein
MEISRRARGRVRLAPPFLHNNAVAVGATISQSTTGVTKAQSALPGSALAGNIYFDPAYVIKNSTGWNAALLMHEVMHNLGPEDPQIMAALNAPAGAVSGYITTTLAADCFGVSH